MISHVALSCFRFANAKMSETARILEFPSRRQAGSRPPEEVRDLSRRYLAMPASERGELTDECLSDADSLLFLCSELSEKCNSSPATVLDEATGIYRWINVSTLQIGFFDDRDYFLGETALIAAGACRLLGRRDDVEVWLDRADANYRHTINSTASLARVAAERLSLHYDMRRYQRVFELVPSLIRSFEALKMSRHALKCRFLEALALKDSDRLLECRERLEAMIKDPALASDPTLQGMVIAHLAETMSAFGEYGEAIAMLRQGLTFNHQPLVAANLKAAAAECLRYQGDLRTAADFLRAAIGDYLAIEMATHVAYLRLILAEILIASSRSREAEWEILAALPTIQAEKMAPEGFVAMVLLHESVKQKKTDPGALRELREHIQARK